MENYVNTAQMDEIDKFLLKEFGIMAGCCSSVESAKYTIARAVAEKLLDKTLEWLTSTIVLDDDEECNLAWVVPFDDVEEMVADLKENLK